MQTNRSCKTSAQTIIRRAKQFVAQKQMQIKTQQTNELNESIYKLGIVCVRKQANAGSFGKFGTVFAQPFFDCYFTHCSVVITENNENKFAIYHFQFEFSSIFICRRVSPLFFSFRPPQMPDNWLRCQIFVTRKTISREILFNLVCHKVMI